MKIPAIKGKIGDWIYYSGIMSFRQINEHVTPSIGEIYQATCLDDVLQRELTSNFHDIKEYLLNDKERFFNAIILAVYDGDPQWLEVEFSESEREYTNVGFLQFSGDETIFPVDGQHRVAGIKEALKVNDDLSGEHVPVIFIAHHKTDDGRKRTRKLFSTLNRRAKPVGKNENIALDEDDVCAIITRDLIQTFPLFMEDNVVNSKGKQIPAKNTCAFTSLITLYQCVDIFVHWYLTKEGFTNRKYKQFLMNRPDTARTEELRTATVAFFQYFFDNTSSTKEYLEKEATNRAAAYRNNNGGNLLFRPVALTEYFSAALQLVDAKSLSFEAVFKKLDGICLDICRAPWNGVIWDGSKIINRVSRPLIRSILIYMTDSTLLSEAKTEKLYDDYAKATNTSREQARNTLLPFKGEI